MDGVKLIEHDLENCFALKVLKLVQTSSIKLYLLTLHYHVIIIRFLQNITEELQLHVYCKNYSKYKACYDTEK